MTGGLAAFLVLMTALAVVMAGVALYIYYGRLIMRSKVVGAPVGFKQMVQMTLSGLDAQSLVIAYLDAHKAGVHVTLEELETIVRKKGDPRAAVKKLIATKGSEINATGEKTNMGGRIAG